MSQASRPKVFSSTETEELEISLLAEVERINAWASAEVSCDLGGPADSLVGRLAQKLAKNPLADKYGAIVQSKVHEKFFEISLNAVSAQEVQRQLKAIRAKCELYADQTHTAEFRSALIRKVIQDYVKFSTDTLIESVRESDTDHKQKLSAFENEYERIDELTDAEIVDLNVRLRMIHHSLTNLANRGMMNFEVRHEPGQDDVKKKARKGDCKTMSIANATNLLAPNWSQRKINIYQL